MKIIYIILTPLEEFISEEISSVKATAHRVLRILDTANLFRKMVIKRM